MHGTCLVLLNSGSSVGDVNMRSMRVKIFVFWGSGLGFLLGGLVDWVSDDRV